MPNTNINTIIEGNRRNTPGIIHYEGFAVRIPKGTELIQIKNHKLILYGHTDFKSPFVKREASPLQTPIFPYLFRDQDASQNPHFIDDLFNTPRSIVTISGEVYLNRSFLDPSKSYYLDQFHTQLYECAEAFTRKTTVEKLNCKRRIILPSRKHK